MRNLFSKIAVSRVAIVFVLFLASHTASADVLKIVVDDVIHPVVTERIARAIQEAQRIHADAVLIELRTPGGLVTATIDITHEILTSPVPVIVYVAPAGNRAASAGFYILEAADIAAMAPGTNTGAAHPVISGDDMDPVLKDKLENDAAAHLRSYSGKRGRNVEVAESAIRQSKSFSADEALSNHLIDYIAKDENDLFRQLDGKPITRFDGSKTVLHLAGKNVIVQEETAETGDSLLHDESKHFLHDFRRRLTVHLFRIQPSRRNFAGSCGFHRCLNFTLHFAIAPFAFHGGGNDYRCLCILCWKPSYKPTGSWAPEASC